MEYFKLFLSISIPLMVLFVSVRVQRIRELEKIKRERRETYKYYLSLLRLVIINIPSQLNSISEKIINLKNDAFDNSRVSIVIEENLMRITDSKSIKDFHAAYIENTQQDNNEIQFLESIQVVDYLLKQYQVLKQYDNLIHESTLVFQDKYREIAEYRIYGSCIEISLSIQNKKYNERTLEDQKLLDKIIELQDEITKTNHFDGLQLHEMFVKPLLEFCSRELQEHNQRSLLINLCRQAVSIYYNSKENKRSSIMEYEKIYNEIERCLHKLIILYRTRETKNTLNRMLVRKIFTFRE